MANQPPFCVPSVEIAGRKKEFEAQEQSRPGIDGNVTPPPIPSTGEVLFYSPGDEGNPIKEIMNITGKEPLSPTVIATDGDQKII